MSFSQAQVSSSPLAFAEMANLISVLATEYNTTTTSILGKLDSVSGDLNALHRLLQGDESIKWSKEEDDLLSKNTNILKQWKG